MPALRTAILFVDGVLGRLKIADVLGRRQNGRRSAALIPIRTSRMAWLLVPESQWLGKAWNDIQICTCPSLAPWIDKRKPY